MKIVFNKVKQKNGWLGNMAPFPINYENQIWLTSEALFQSMRFNDQLIKEIIRKEKSPMGAKMKAKHFSEHMIIQPMSNKDVENMKKCVRLKFEQHSDLKRLLLQTGNCEIIEDIGTRNGVRHKFWGAKKISLDKFEGINMMGRILMELREEIRRVTDD